MAKVYAPLENYNGISASVEFVDGVAETDNDNLLEWFEERGYIVECDEKTKSANKAKEKPSDSTTADTLKEVDEGNE
ncbi:hypothetical protein [Veillonella montpellierensis]|uniref:hypothetical protein n=1 Tax=Veillonella montpellierensis TaxID=187328 RepID=UPI0023F9A9E5|nr:hypothetical protein [Veillonella montpellierensis]